MFTRDDMMKLAGITDRDDLVRAVNEIPDEDVRAALVMAIALMRRNVELGTAQWNKKDDECKRLQKKLDKALAELEKLKKA